MFKRISALVLSAVIAVSSLAGCSGNKDDIVDTPYRRGYWAKNTFVSRYTGTLYNMPESWSRFSESDFEEMAANMNLGESVIFDMASASADGKSIIMFGEELESAEITEEQYAESLKENLQNADSDYKYTVLEKGRLKFLEQEYTKLDVKVTSDSLEKAQWYIMRKIDGNMVVFVFTAGDTAAIEEMAKSFSVCTDDVNQEGFGSEDSSKDKTMFKKGKWKETDGVNVFENQTMRLRFKAKDTWRVLPEDELNALSGNDGNGNSQQLTIADGYENVSAFDFGVSTENGSTIVMLAEDLGISDLTKNINERGYAEMLEKNLSLTDMKYEFSDAEEIELAGRTFLKLPVTAADGKAHQWYMMDRVGVYMITIIATSSSENTGELDEFIQAFEQMEEVSEEETEQAE